jgi:hypothetical protein
MFIIAAAVSLVYAVGLILMPATLNAMYGMDSTAATRLLAQFFGVGLLTLGLINWLARDFTGANARPLLLAGVIGNAVGLIVSLLGTLGGAMGSLGWSAVLIYLLIGLGWAYFLFMAPSR